MGNDREKIIIYLKIEGITLDFGEKQGIQKIEAFPNVQKTIEVTIKDKDNR